MYCSSVNNKKDKTGYFWFVFLVFWLWIYSLLCFLLFCFVFRYLKPFCKTPLQYSANSEGWAISYQHEWFDLPCFLKRPFPLNWILYWVSIPDVITLSWFDYDWERDGWLEGSVCILWYCWSELLNRFSLYGLRVCLLFGIWERGLNLLGLTVKLPIDVTIASASCAAELSCISFLMRVTSLKLVLMLEHSLPFNICWGDLINLLKWFSDISLPSSSKNEVYPSIDGWSIPLKIRYTHLPWG